MDATNEIHHTGIRHTIIEGFVKQTGTETIIANATIQNIQTGKEAITDIVGNYHLEKFHPGTFTFQATAAGYKPLIKTIQIHRGETLEIDFNLAPV